MAHQKQKSNADLLKFIRGRLYHYKGLTARNAKRAEQAEELKTLIQNSCKDLVRRDELYREKINAILSEL